MQRRNSSAGVYRVGVACEADIVGVVEVGLDRFWREDVVEMVEMGLDRFWLKDKVGVVDVGLDQLNGV